MAPRNHDEIACHGFRNVSVTGDGHYEIQGRLGVVQAQAADATALAAAPSSAGEDEGVCTIM